MATDSRFSLDGIVFELEHKQIRHMYLRVKPDSEIVRVTAPFGMAMDEIKIAAESRLAWVRKCLKKKHSSLQADPLRWQPVWGRLCPVRFEFSEAPAIHLAENEIVARLPQKPDAETWTAIMRAWRKNLVEAAAPPLLEKWRRTLKLGATTLEVRAMKCRWGTCYPGKNKILLNSQLATRPQNCLDYVICHEMLHFFWPNHGAEFKNAIASHWPDWRELDAMLVPHNASIFG